jgi:2-haloacid dehalogenase
MPGFIPGGFDTFEQWLTRIVELCNTESDAYIYAYWTEPDSCLHELGADAPAVKTLLRDMERKIESALKQIRNKTDVLITADHGHTDIESLFIDDFPELLECLVHPLSLESRCVSMFIKPERIAEFPEFEDAIRLYHSEWMKTMGEEIPGMYELIKSLKEKYPVIYGLTNWSNETFPMVQKKYRIFSLIDNIVCSGDEKLLKPDPKIYHTLLERYNLKAEESVFIDDNINNVKGAINVGMKSIHFVNAEQLQKDLNELLNQE